MHMNLHAYEYVYIGIHALVGSPKAILGKGKKLPSWGVGQQFFTCLFERLASHPNPKLINVPSEQCLRRIVDILAEY